MYAPKEIKGENNAMGKNKNVNPVSSIGHLFRDSLGNYILSLTTEL